MFLPTIRQLGHVAYQPTCEAMQQFTDARTASTPDELWVVEHSPIFTLGLAADLAHILDAHSIPVVRTDRGGEVTYHGPGQSVTYLMLDLRRPRNNGHILRPREFITAIEQAIINTLKHYKILGVRRSGAPGIYVETGPLHGAKIAALGLKIRANGCTYHGVSLNVAMDLTPFTWIHPCGYPNLMSTDMRSLGIDAPFIEIQNILTQELTTIF